MEAAERIADRAFVPAAEAVEAGRIPGAVLGIVLADGSSATVRLARSYNAASGRECRVVEVASGAQSRTICATGNGGWAEARPLLRGGGAPR